MRRAARVVNPGQRAGFKPMRWASPGAWWLALCRVTETNADAWADRFGLSGNQMFHKLNAEAAFEGDSNILTPGSVPEDIWLALGELKEAADKL
jgi:hypothetical protein